jgi:Dna[CI] antecedent, DciA
MAQPKNSRQTEVTPIGEAIAAMLKSFGLEDRYHEAELINGWSKVGQALGKPVARYTKRIFVHKRTLYIELSSAPLKNELAMNRTQILALLTQDKPGLVDELVFL